MYFFFLVQFLEAWEFVGVENKSKNIPIFNVSYFSMQSDEDPLPLMIEDVVL